jgi:hypothetical protein
MDGNYYIFRNGEPQRIPQLSSTASTVAVLSRDISYKSFDRDIAIGLILAKIASLVKGAALYAYSGTPKVDMVLTIDT